jgi:hypothetical protein
MHKYHTCFASHLPPIFKKWDAQPYLRTGLNTRKAIFDKHLVKYETYAFAYAYAKRMRNSR